MNRLQALKESGFIPTKEYKRFAEFCNVCLTERYIGICYGPAGVGKTLSAEFYSRQPLIDTLIDNPYQRTLLRRAKFCNTVLFTASVTSTPSRIESELTSARYRLSKVVNSVKTMPLNDLTSSGAWSFSYDNPDQTQLIIVDETDRLKESSLEHLRDIYDRNYFGMIFIGMPGLERRLKRYAQLYSRVGFAHEFKPLQVEEMIVVLTHKWRELGLILNPANSEDTEALSAIIRYTDGNFRLIHRLFRQMKRIMGINQLDKITIEVVETAREMMVFGVA